MKIIYDNMKNIRKIISKKSETITMQRTDDKMRRAFYTLKKIEGRFFIIYEGNVSPNNLPTIYFEISEQAAENISKDDEDVAWLQMENLTT